MTVFVIANMILCAPMANIVGGVGSAHNKATHLICSKALMDIVLFCIHLH